jgi:cell division protein FtsB
MDRKVKLLGRSWLTFIIFLLMIILQSRLWVDPDGYSKTLDLRLAVKDQLKENKSLGARNQFFEAEIYDLKHGKDAADERARRNLGMIGNNEIFYMVVPRNNNETN